MPPRCGRRRVTPYVDERRLREPGVHRIASAKTIRRFEQPPKLREGTAPLELHDWAVGWCRLSTHEVDRHASFSVSAGIRSAVARRNLDRTLTSKVNTTLRDVGLAAQSVTRDQRPHHRKLQHSSHPTHRLILHAHNDVCRRRPFRQRRGLRTACGALSRYKGDRPPPSSLSTMRKISPFVASALKLQQSTHSRAQTGTMRSTGCCRTARSDRARRDDAGHRRIRGSRRLPR